MFAAEFEPAVLTNRRRVPRAPVSMEARMSGLERALCKVVDLSTHGARLHTYTVMRPGQTIWLTLPALGPVIADVRWVDEYTAGCQFLTPLTIGQYETLLAHG